MGFLQEVVSVLPSIASIVAPLFKAKTNDYLKFALHNGKSVYFKKDEKGEICVYNPFSEPISLVFPNKNGIGGESVDVKATDHFPVTGMLVNRAAACIDDFQITKGGVKTNHAANDLGKESVVATISASGKVPNMNETTKIGTSMFAKLEGNDLVLQVVPPYNLEGVVTLEVSGDGNQPCRLFKNAENDGSVPSPVMQTNSSIEMRFPGAVETFRDSGNLFVSATARCSYSPNKLIQDEAYRGIHTTEDDWGFLKTGRCLNG